MFRFLVAALGMLTAHERGRRQAPWYRIDDPYQSTVVNGYQTADPHDNTVANGYQTGEPYLSTGAHGYQAGPPHRTGGHGYQTGEPFHSTSRPILLTDPSGRGGGDAGARQTRLRPPSRPGADGPSPAVPGRRPGRPGPRPRRIPPWAKRTAAVLAVGLVFRRAIASIVMITLAAALHLAGINVHLPSIKFAWPWQTLSATTTDTDLGPWVLQKIEGISKPALGETNFSFFFTHKVSKSIGPWPCWYASTFYAAGHASATVNLNPGPAWWAPGAGHYRLQVLSPPRAGRPGHVTVMMVFPQPQLPQSVHDVTIDNIASKPIVTQHSWTYPGLACGMVLRPQFPESVLYSQAQHIAFYKATHVPQVMRPLLSSARTQAAQTVRDNFIQPTLNALGYTLDQFNIRWTAAP